MPTVREESFFDPRCPFCFEKVSRFVRICPHCRSDLASDARFQAAAKQKGDLQNSYAVSFVFCIVAGIIIVVLLLLFH